MTIKAPIRILFATILLLAMSGCASRSISNSGYYSGNSFYQGELREFDIIGQLSPEQVTVDSIRKAYQQGHAPIRLSRGAPVMIIQSGAITPDQEFVTEINSYFAAVPFSGVPESDRRFQGNPAPQKLDKSLRMAAAQGGIKTIICYWGVLETARHDHATKVVSWIPIAGHVFPDEKQEMRIRLKAIVLDVPSGNWSMLTSPPIEDNRTSAKLNRETSDQKQVAVLKQKAYASLVQFLLEKHT